MLVTIGWLLAFIGMFITAGNFAIVFGWYALKKHGTLVLVLGGLAGAGACLTLPFSGLTTWWYWPLLIDPGSAALMVMITAFCARQLFKQVTNRDG